MKYWEIPVTWEMYGTVQVEAKTLEEAMEIAQDEDGVIPLPDKKEYVDGSWRVAYDIDEAAIRQCWNNNQEDEIG